ncbi:DUF4158 domain-containing protein [Nostoc flagelliforme]|uniref:DUF4158 domain-containing protein n=1 Tax=Nostoc flagelliforme TaxID=1306274 RepID=UPI000C2D0298|nr:DUF4158 domain-containing protein [Nostoc flagelliforme]
MPSEIVLGYENNKTMYRHRVAIREYLKVNDFDKNARHLAALAVHESAKVMDNPADLINVAIGELIKQRYELPGFYTLDRLVRRIRHLVNQKIFNFVINRLEQEYIEYINSLLDSIRPKGLPLLIISSSYPSVQLAIISMIYLYTSLGWKH